jgi:hypothetical protein
VEESSYLHIQMQLMKVIPRVPVLLTVIVIFFAAILPSCRKKNAAPAKTAGGTWILNGYKDSSYSVNDTVKHISIPIMKWEVSINNNYPIFNQTLARNRKAVIIPSLAADHMPLSDSTYHGVFDTLPCTDSNSRSKSYSLLLPGITPTGKPIPNAISASVYYDTEQDTIYVEYYWWLDVRASKANLITVSGKRK